VQIEPPCSLELKKSRAQGFMLGKYEPDCDEDGYYKPRQCHENYCWCVDRFNQMIEGSKKESRFVTCRKYAVCDHSLKSKQDILNNIFHDERIARAQPCDDPIDPRYAGQGDTYTLSSSSCLKQLDDHSSSKLNGTSHAGLRKPDAVLTLTCKGVACIRMSPPGRMLKNIQ
jgi:hypothetical protein